MRESLRGLGLLLLGTLGCALLMALPGARALSVPLGALATLVATFGALELSGLSRPGTAPPDRSATLRELGRPLASTALAGLALYVLLRAAVAGRLDLGLLSGALGRLVSPESLAFVAIPASFLALVVGVYRVGEGLGVFGPDADGTARPLLRRHGFALIVAVTLLYLPRLGARSLLDPWETHYGEVAREMIARDDWISLWWAQDGWFWSKPVLDFWVQGLGMSLLGVRTGPDAMLSAAGAGLTPFPEWAVRLPIFLLTLLGTYLLYKAVAAVFGRRAGLLGGLALTSMPQWFLLGQQTMTDMPFVATLSGAMALMLLGLQTDEAALARSYELRLGARSLRLSAATLALGAVVAAVVPQVAYLLSRHVSLAGGALSVHADRFASGSPGNCGLPGNEACRAAVSVYPGFAPALQALLWVALLALILVAAGRERRVRRLYFLGAWFFAGLSTMAKGPAGLVLPALCVLAYLAIARRPRELFELEIPTGLLIVAAIVLPWMVAMLVRHGQPFTDRLLFHDMVKRAFSHVHDTNEGDDVSFRFYVWQLGYATFPLTGLVPHGDDRDLLGCEGSHRRDRGG